MVSYWFLGILMNFLASDEIEKLKNKISEKEKQIEGSA